MWRDGLEATQNLQNCAAVPDLGETSLLNWLTTCLQAAEESKGGERANKAHEESEVERHEESEVEKTAITAQPRKQKKRNSGYCF